jgi:hypothetical protein
MAEEVAGRPVDALASFTSWDDGRRKLDGMAKGRRWDIDRESRALKRETEKLCDRLRYKRWLAANKDRAKAYWREYWRRPENAARARERQKRKRGAERKSPARWAKRLASFERHKAKKRARAKERYRANLEASRERARRNAAKYYRRHREEILARAKERDRKCRPREGKRRCSACGQPGHNKVTCAAAEAR